MKALAIIWEVGKVVLGVLIAALIIRYFIFQPFIVDGSSMEPNFHNGEYLFVEKLSYDFHQPRRGDVVVFKYPLDPSTDYIKRVIGLPGDTVTIQGGNVYVNGVSIQEPYLAAGQKTVSLTDPSTTYQVTVGANQYFVLGDNRDHSADSREGWLVPQQNIIGKTEVVLFPLHDLHVVVTPHY